MQPRWGGVDGGKRGNIGCHAAVRDGGTAVQTSFRMGDDVHLFAASLIENLPDAGRQFFSTVLHGSGGLLPAVIDRSAVAL